MKHRQLHRERSDALRLLGRVSELRSSRFNCSASTQPAVTVRKSARPTFAVAGAPSSSAAVHASARVLLRNSRACPDSQGGSHRARSARRWPVESSVALLWSQAARAHGTSPSRSLEHACVGFLRAIGCEAPSVPSAGGKLRRHVARGLRVRPACACAPNPSIERTSSSASRCLRPPLMSNVRPHERTRLSHALSSDAFAAASQRRRSTRSALHARGSTRGSSEGLCASRIVRRHRASCLSAGERRRLSRCFGHCVACSEARQRRVSYLGIVRHRGRASARTGLALQVGSLARGQLAASSSAQVSGTSSASAELSRSLVLAIERAVRARAERVSPNPSIERTSQRPLRALCAAAHVER